MSNVFTNNIEIFFKENDGIDFNLLENLIINLVEEENCRVEMQGTYFGTQGGEMIFESKNFPPRDLIIKINNLLSGFENLERHLIELRWRDEGFNSVGAIASSYQSNDIAYVESQEYFDPPEFGEDNYQTKWDKMIDEVQKEKKLCLEKAKKMLFDDVSK